MDRERYRNTLDVWNDQLWPSGVFGGPDVWESVRHQAINEVLCCIPPADYEKLKQLADVFDWCVPHYNLYGELRPVFATGPDDDPYLPYVVQLYLSPRLETAAWSVVLAVVAHEVAHLVLGHNLMGRGDYDAQEEAAWNLVCSWGYQNEVRQHHAMIKRRETNEQRLIEKLSRGRG